MEHARAYSALIEGPRRVLDLGSGGGVPGLVLAVERPDLQLVLVDAAERRAAFLDRAVHELGVGERVTVQRGRAEELARRTDLRGSVEVVVARSFGPPAVTAECAIGFLGGVDDRLLVSEPPEGGADRWPSGPLEELGLEWIACHRDRGVGISELRVVADVASRWPRRTGVPSRRPVF